MLWLMVFVPFFIHTNHAIVPAVPAAQPEELGTVKWLRNFDEALAVAKKSDKPVLILFQEVPGCATCRNYGNNVLSHPLLAEAIETIFVPLAIYNNKDGEDAKVLKRYGEPAWNNPVVRIVDQTGKDIIPRVNGNYTAWGLVQAMLQALDLQSRVAPAYLDLLNEEFSAELRGTETATFPMYCFWTGEGHYGNTTGVVATQPGFMEGREVVQVTFDPAVVSYEKLIRTGKKASCADGVFYHNAAQKSVAEKVLVGGVIAAKSNFKTDKEPKYYLSKTHYRFVPMTPLQAARANALAGKGQNPQAVLSPRQIELAKLIQQHPQKPWKSRIGEAITTAWAATEATRIGKP
ncbi:MAG: thioredoxin family protein [Saprospiraceae bacterium]|nr:thioredoxin family protein [Saprospiraceae bacterium]